MTQNIMTSHNIEKSFKVILNAFKRRNINLQPYELKEIESIAKHIENSFNSILSGYSVFESMTSLLMFYYVEKTGCPKKAVHLLKKDLDLGLNGLNTRLHSAILSRQIMDLTEDLTEENATPERIKNVTESVINSYTIEQVAKSVNKTATDLLIIDNYE